MKVEMQSMFLQKDGRGQARIVLDISLKFWQTTCSLLNQNTTKVSDSSASRYFMA
jgi:hypothetical protein